MAPRPRLLVATYNIHRAVGADGRVDVARVGQVLHELAADIVALQEVDCEAPGDANHMARLAAVSGMYATGLPLVHRAGASVGIAILSRHPITAQRSIDLSVGKREPRAALDVDVETPMGSLRVVNTHLGLKIGERAWQISRLLEHITAERPTAVLGDFNEWRWGSPGLAQLRAIFGQTPAPRSFPARRPVFALDRVFVHPVRALVSTQVMATVAARRASDHLPVRAILELD